MNSLEIMPDMFKFRGGALADAGLLAPTRPRSWSSLDSIEFFPDMFGLGITTIRNTDASAHYGCIQNFEAIRKTKI